MTYHSDVHADLNNAADLLRYWMNEKHKENYEKNMNTEVAIKQTQECYIPSPSDWDFMLKWGSQAIKSGMIPSGIRTPEAAAIIVLKGRELGLSFMTAVAHIHVISGKPTMSAELIQGMARRNLPGLVINILESSSTISKIEIIRPEKGSKPYIQSFTWEDATKAGLTNKDVWIKYPSAMLWSRCITSALRKVCPDALMGISYTPEELDADIDGDGNVIETSSRILDEQPQQSHDVILNDPRQYSDIGTMTQVSDWL